jgi:alpha-ketoglutarate-dependent taurine dioxygenase
LPPASCLSLRSRWYFDDWRFFGNPFHYFSQRALIEDINAAITLQARVYTHRRAPRQCIVWDNRCTLRRATGFDEARLKRVMRRCAIVGDKPF